MNRGRGYIADPSTAYAHTVAAHHLIGISPAPPAAAVPWMPPVWDQGSTSSCVGMSLSVNLGSQLRQIVSPLSIYALARATARGGPAEHLVDEGTFPWAAAQAIAKWGAAPLEKWPFVSARINAEPVLAELEACEPLRKFTPHRIPEGPDAAEDVARAIASGRCVSFGIDVTQGFEDYAGGVLTRLSGSQLGGHYLCAYAYETTALGRVFRVRNSWSESWGESGDFLCTDSFIDSEASDIYVLEVQS